MLFSWQQFRAYFMLKNYTKEERTVPTFCENRGKLPSFSHIGLTAGPCLRERSRRRWLTMHDSVCAAETWKVHNNEQDVACLILKRLMPRAEILAAKDLEQTKKSAEQGFSILGEQSCRLHELCSALLWVSGSCYT